MAEKTFKGWTETRENHDSRTDKYYKNDKIKNDKKW